jgi:hypothetical protein
MKRLFGFQSVSVLFVVFVSLSLRAQPAPVDLWELGRKEAATHRFSTLFTAQDVHRHLSNDDGLQQAMDWCKKTAVTKVYIETFRDGYQADKAALENARDKFKAAGFVVSGCVTPTKVGKSSTGWKDTISCYTDKPTQEKVKAIFEHTAALFDEIMIDDFWFTDCACPECEAARTAKTVAIGEKKFPVSGEAWDDYRCELMVQISREYVLATAKKVNPNAKLIIKYPQWYDNFHVRGYEVLRETADFDWTWVGTETRDYEDKRWGGTVQYEAYFIMRWLGGIGGAKCGGGWYDWLGTTEKTYLEQARMTVLGGARESMLFCYGGLLGTTGPKNIEELRKHIPRLLALAKEVAKRKPIGLAAYKPANPENEKRVYDFVGMLGLPLAPCHEFPTTAPAAFFPVHALKDPDLAAKLGRFIGAGKPVLITDGLKAKLEGKVKLDGPNVFVLPVKGDPKSLLTLTREELDKMREPLLRPFKTSFKAPNKVALFLYSDGSWGVCNFNDDVMPVELNRIRHQVADRGWLNVWK